MIELAQTRGGAADPDPAETRSTIEFAWPVLLCAVTLLALASDYLGLPAGDVTMLLRAVFASGLVYLTLVLVGERIRGSSWLSPLAAVIALAVLWHYSGTLANPAFTSLMAAPVLLAGISARRGLPYLVALAALVAVVVTALHDHAEVRWYIERWGWTWPQRWTAAEADTARTFAVQLSPLAARPDAFFATFGAAMAACALIGSTIGALLEAYRNRYRQAAALGAESRRLVDELLATEAAPGALVAPDHGTVIAASPAFAGLLGDGPVVGRPLLRLLASPGAESMQAVLAGAAPGLDELQVLRIGGGERLFRIRLAPLELDRETVFRLQLQPPRPAEYLELGLDQLSVSVIALDGDERVVAADRGACALFPGLAVGQPAAGGLAAGGPPDWWRIAPRRRLRCPLRIGARDFEAEIVRHRPFGADRALSFISLTRAAPG